MLIYVAGPYSAPTAEGIERNVAMASTVAAQLWKLGHSVICPHANTHLPGKYVHLKTEQWIAGDLQQLAVCDAVVLLPGWPLSAGTAQEREFAIAHGIPIFDLDGVPPETIPSALPRLHQTEVNCPAQVDAFRIVLGQMMRIHLEKNADYSPANILGTGYIGLVTRLWDKTARLLNLAGFRLHMTEPATFEAPRLPKHESVEQNLIDAAVYPIIGLLLRRGVWGR